MAGRSERRLGLVLGLTLVVALPGAGCRSPQPRASSGPYSPTAAGARDTAAAEELTRRAGEVADLDAPEAERLLRAALTADLFHGPAHNNLGVLFLRQGKCGKCFCGGSN